MNEVLSQAKVVPAVGDSVLFHLNGSTLTKTPALAVNGDQPLHAVVVYAWGPAMVNLQLIDHNGVAHAQTSVPFLQPGDVAPASGIYCELAVVLGEQLEAVFDWGTEVRDAPSQSAAAALRRGVTLADIEAEIVSTFFFTAADGVLGESELGTAPAARLGLDRVTFAVLTLRNSTKVVGVNYGAIDPGQHSVERGRAEAREAAIEQIWPLMGYELRSKLAQQG